MWWMVEEALTNDRLSHLTPHVLVGLLLFCLLGGLLFLLLAMLFSLWAGSYSLMMDFA